MPGKTFVPRHLGATLTAQEICHLLLGEAGTFAVGPQIVVQLVMHEKVSGDVAERAKPRNHAIKREISPKAGKLAAPGKFWA